MKIRVGLIYAHKQKFSMLLNKAIFCLCSDDLRVYLFKLLVNIFISNKQVTSEVLCYV